MKKTRQRQGQVKLENAALGNEHVRHASGKWKTVCTSTVLAFLGVNPASFHYCSNERDMKRILGNHGFSVASRRSAVKGATVGQIRKGVAALDEAAHYLIFVPGHVLLMDNTGATVCDTAGRIRDGRRVDSIVRVCRK